MAGLNFDNLPVSTLMGSKWSNFKAIVEERQVDANYHNKYRRTRFLSWLLNATQAMEDRQFEKLLAHVDLRHDPVFVLGHWRSGTTFLHNILASDPHFGYNTTYQTVFPNKMLWGQAFFKWVMSYIIPDKRPTDNMELEVDQPQEEEFSLSNILPYTYYNFWTFPRDMMEYCDKYLLMNNFNGVAKKRFKEEYVRLIKTALHNTGGDQFLSKNPPHTTRIPLLLEMFPNAKFIYLMRNPYTVFESTRSFFSNTIRPLQFQNFSSEEMERNILEVYKLMYHKYEHDKHLIPEGNLLEIKFEDIEGDAFGAIKEVYEKLKISDFEKARAPISAYLDKKKGYKKNAYDYTQETIDKVNNNWAFAIDQWEYEKL